MCPPATLQKFLRVVSKYMGKQVLHPTNFKNLVPKVHKLGPKSSQSLNPVVTNNEVHGCIVSCLFPWIWKKREFNKKLLIPNCSTIIKSDFRVKNYATTKDLKIQSKFEPNYCLLWKKEGLYLCLFIVVCHIGYMSSARQQNKLLEHRVLLFSVFDILHNAHKTDQSLWPMSSMTALLYRFFWESQP
jgi:hypothetical protein